jgi:hypothetical protein
VRFNSLHNTPQFVQFNDAFDVPAFCLPLVDDEDDE